MNRRIAIAAIATIGLGGLTACNPIPQALNTIAVTNTTSSPAWDVTPYADHVAFIMTGYPAGTVGYASVGSSPSSTLQDGIATSIKVYTAGNWTLLITAADGTTLVNEYGPGIAVTPPACG